MNRPNRFEALDALRGFAILGMSWSGMLPDTLPAWMYHIQEPPPDHVFNDQIFGLSWVDLVFPLFLFSMGVAIPLALAGKLSRPPGLSPARSAIRLAPGLIARGLLLAAFALIGEHLRPYDWESSPGTATWLVSILGFGLLVLMFFRWPSSVNVKLRRTISIVAWVAAQALIFTHRYPDGLVGFRNSRVDIILMVLANVSVTASLIWILTRCRRIVRLGVVAGVALVFLTAKLPGSLGNLIWDFNPIAFIHQDQYPWGRFLPILYHFEYQKYLMIVLLGTVAGDLLAERSQLEPSEAGLNPRSRWGIVLLGIAVPIVTCIGLTAREVPLTGVALGLVLLGLFGLVRGSASPSERLVAKLVHCGAAVLFLGLLAEPLGGGIRKDSATLSYFFVTSGIGFILLAALAVWVEQLGRGRSLRLIAQTGANPILGYIAITNLVMGLAGLTIWGGWWASHGVQDWWLALIDGGVKTLAVALVTAWFTRRGWFLRA